MGALKCRKLQEVDVKGRHVLVRVDYNVPLDGTKVVDATRIRETLPTLKHLTEAGAKVALIAHLGRPKGQPTEKFSLKPVADTLADLLKVNVRFAADCVGTVADDTVAGLKDGEVALLENLRFHSGEESNDPEFAKQLAKHGEIFVQDAFGALHRSHASTAGVPQNIPGSIGFLVQKELEFLDRVVGNPVRPFLAILGGAKVSDKIKVIHRLLDRVDTFLIGGGMAYTFMHAQGVSIGKSLLEKDCVGDAQEIIEKAYAKGVELLLPADHLCAEEFKADSKVHPSQGMAIPEALIGVDIGPRSIQLFAEKIAEAKTVFWNGPMGVFEMEPFAKGSLAVAQAMAEGTEGGATTIVGGGDSLALIHKAELNGKMTHCSTGGGASLELLEGKMLPGLAALSTS
jgi:phosphoglycerate kinase